MYIHVAKDLIIKDESILGIFNLNYIGNNKEFKNLRSKLKEDKALDVITPNKEKIFILTENKGFVKGYITNIGINTIEKRKKELERK